MRTGFTDAQRADPDIAAADKVIRTCVHCGFCLPACPTYRLTGDELDGPRGRIWLMRDLLESGPEPGTGRAAPAADPSVATHLDRCLGCLACMPACPSGVDYRTLLGIGRDVLESRAERGLFDRLSRRVLGRVLPEPRLFAAMIRLARPLAFLGAELPGRLGAALSLARDARVRRGAEAAPGVHPADGAARGRVALIPGCAQSVLAPGINGALIRVLNRAGIEAVVLRGPACCGALNEHLGEGERARALARRVIAAVIAEAEGAGLDAVVQTASGCGTFMKAYGGLLAGDAEWRERAERVARLTRDAGEYLAGLDLAFSDPAGGERVAWQAPCSLANGQGAAGAARELLERAGYEVAEPPEGPVCCGSAGTYNLTEPEIAARLGADKAASLDGLGAEVVASSNLGCMMQLAPRLAAPVVHMVELVDRAQGGPAPPALAAAAKGRGPLNP